MNVIYGNEIQPSLRDLACLRSAPNAEALGYFPPVPPGREARRPSIWIQPRIGDTEAQLVSPQRGVKIRLLEAGHVVDPKTEHGETPLPLVCWGASNLSPLRHIHNAALRFDESMYRREENMRYVQCVRLLVAHGADVNHETDLGTTPLRNAIICGQTEIESILWLAGATNEGKGEPLPGPVRR